jgi:ABC-type dipeptide/oligopeptide/nickel transport system permease subunit
MLSHPALMLPPGIAVMLVSATSGFLSDSLRNVLDVKYTNKKDNFKVKDLIP